jgi:hypothetical protein
MKSSTDPELQGAAPRIPGALLLRNPRALERRDANSPFPYFQDILGFNADGAGDITPVQPRAGLSDADLREWRELTLPWHGTAVAEYALGGADNIVKNFELLSKHVALTFARVFTGSILSEQGLPTADLNALRHSLSYTSPPGIQIVNVSLGSRDATPSVLEAVKLNSRSDWLIVAAAGNEANSPGYPARYALVHNDSVDMTGRLIAVGAHDPKGHRTKESNFGGSVEIYAPGCKLKFKNDLNQDMLLHGTSLAAPLVSFAAALLRATWQYSAIEIKSRLLRTAQPVRLAGGKTIRLLDPVAALHALDTTVILRGKDHDAEWPVPSDRYRFGSLQALQSGGSPNWCYSDPTAETMSDPWDYGQLARIDFVAVMPGDRGDRRFKAEVLLRDPNDPISIAEPTVCYFSEEDIGPQFELQNEDGTTMPISLEQIRSIILPFGIPQPAFQD